jgi:hypothetical protein
MDYLTRLKNLQDNRVEADKTDKSHISQPGHLISRFVDAHQVGSSSLPSDQLQYGRNAPPSPCVKPCDVRNTTPLAPPVPGTLPNGEQVLRETWGCLGCATRSVGTPTSPAPEGERAIPPGTVSSPCPNCHKPQRFFVRASPNIQGEPKQDVLICGKCGRTEPVCPECKHTNVVMDSLGPYCVDCQKRPGQPKTAPEPEPRGDPLLLTSHRHRLGEQPPSFDCRTGGARDWREAIYHWACRGCQQIEMKPEDSAWPDAQDRPPA